ncbi:hypothetical protein A3197_17080 [Candidatus Thiodiazotropha endoloripes]|nr:hypothetical protein [Candidatus Thiodiazotropha weberae]ODB95080.1 hypothetical protein A3197_17080 [Candidatus Thiodiazotropha endoloripes]
MDCNPALVENTVDHIELDRSQSSLSTPQKKEDIIDEALEDIGALATSISLTGSGDELVGRLNRLASTQPKYFEQATAELLRHHRGCHLGCGGQ